MHLSIGEVMQELESTVSVMHRVDYASNSHSNVSNNSNNNNESNISNTSNSNSNRRMKRQSIAIAPLVSI
jgi:hypothetical protein